MSITSNDVILISGRDEVYSIQQNVLVTSCWFL